MTTGRINQVAAETFGNGLFVPSGQPRLLRERPRIALVQKVCSLCLASQLCVDRCVRDFLEQNASSHGFRNCLRKLSRAAPASGPVLLRISSLVWGPADRGLRCTNTKMDFFKFPRRLRPGVLDVHPRSFLRGAVLRVHLVRRVFFIRRE